MSAVVKMPRPSARRTPGDDGLPSASATTARFSTSLRRRRIEADRRLPPTMAIVRRPGRVRAAVSSVRASVIAGSSAGWVVCRLDLPDAVLVAAHQQDTGVEMQFDSACVVSTGIFGTQPDSREMPVSYTHLRAHE